MRYSRLIPVLSITLTILLGVSLVEISYGGSLGARSGGGGFSSPGLRGGTFGRGSSVIGDGAGGFKTYSPSGTSRYINSPGSSGKVYHPDGSSSTVIDDGAGNLNIYGPQGTHKAYGNSKPTPSDRK